MKKFIWFLACCIAVAVPALGQQEININARGPIFDIGRNLTWGNSGTVGINNTYIVYSSNPWPANGVCIYVRNNNPSSNHAFTENVEVTPDGSLTSLSQRSSNWQVVATLNENVSNILAVGSVESFFLPLTGAAKFLVQIIASTSASGSPDTGDILAVASNGSGCTGNPFAQANYSIPAVSSLNTTGAQSQTFTSNAPQTTSQPVNVLYSITASNPNTSVEFLQFSGGVNWCQPVPASGVIAFAIGNVGLHGPSTTLTISPSTNCTTIVAPTSALTFSVAFN